MNPEDPQWQYMPEFKGQIFRYYPLDSNDKRIIEALNPSALDITRIEVYSDKTRRVCRIPIEVTPEQEQLGGYLQAVDDHLDFPLPEGLSQAVYFHDNSPAATLDVGLKEPIIVDYTEYPDDRHINSVAPVHLEYEEGRLSRCQFYLGRRLPVDALTKDPALYAFLIFMTPGTTYSRSLSLTDFNGQGLHWYDTVSVHNYGNEEAFDLAREASSKWSRDGFASFPFRFASIEGVDISARLYKDQNRLSIRRSDKGRLRLQLAVPLTIPHQQIRAIFDDPEADFRAIRPLIGIQEKIVASKRKETK